MGGELDVIKGGLELMRSRPIVAVKTATFSVVQLSPSSGA